MRAKRGVAAMSALVIGVLIASVITVVVPSIDKLFFDGEIIANTLEGRESKSQSEPSKSEGVESQIEK